ncbi:MAG: 2-amino-4-hydroxy-6-hydroxymethyldihydropteridine diphosphokinase, partial [Chloroflexi bacterium]|nr:2-amino-4-hydroxy-6-hydroxymethyldihydropteridine diphosphokinase [Chloroflexota bacterium]
NLGDRAANLKAVIEALAPEVDILDQSAVYETEPWGFLDQPNFLNQVLKAETRLNPQELLKYIKGIEIRIGREPSFRFGPRLVDIDILLYGRVRIKEDHLVIPHASLRERAFVLVPLLEISPEIVYPGTTQPLSDLLQNLEPAQVKPFQD